MIPSRLVTNPPVRIFSVPLAVALLGAALAIAPACDRGETVASRALASASRAPAEPARERAAPSAGTAPQTPPQAQPPDTSRRIIRTAEVSLETDAPEAALQSIMALAESKGGFVVSSNANHSRSEDGAENIAVSIVFRVPPASFDVALQALHALAKRVASETTAGQDVTEEYVDLEARLKAQRAVEQQYFSILKEAKKIQDILEVEQKIGEIRTEIDRAEGRLRYLENQAGMSTITVHLAKQIEAVDAHGLGFGASVHKAARDALIMSVDIINGVIGLLAVLAPIAVLLGVPGYFVALLFWRRRKRAFAAAA
jgi:hypothetical protein